MTDRECSCGCDRFRFRFEEEEDHLWLKNICVNCGHSLVEHTNLVKHQAE